MCDLPFVQQDAAEGAIRLNSHLVFEGDYPRIIAADIFDVGVVGFVYQSACVEFLDSVECGVLGPETGSVGPSRFVLA